MTTNEQAGGEPAFPQAAVHDPNHGVTTAGAYFPGVSGITKREYFAAKAPPSEVDAIIGETAEDAAVFLGVTPKQYNYKTHYHLAAAKARFMWADAMLAESRKEGR